MRPREVAIIGGGPAGIAAALQLKRYRIDFILFEGRSMGGLIGNAQMIENYPGFPGGVSGADFVRLLQKQANRFKNEIQWEQVKGLDYLATAESFLITTDQTEYQANFVIVATGTLPRLPDGFENISPEIRGKICFDVRTLIEKKSQRIIIVGAGDIAFDFALSLAPHHDVYLLNRSTQVKALPLLYRRVQACPSITMFNSTVIESIDLAKDGCLEVVVKRGEETDFLPADFILYAIGRRVSKTFYSKNILDLEVDLCVKGKMIEIGDLKNGPYRQVAIAAGDGLKAAMQMSQSIRVE